MFVLFDLGQTVRTESTPLLLAWWVMQGFQVIFMFHTWDIGAAADGRLVLMDLGGLSMGALQLSKGQFPMQDICRSVQTFVACRCLQHTSYSSSVA